METIEIIGMVNSGISVLALILSIILKRKSPKTSKTLEEIGEEAQKLANSYIQKQCKKNHIENTKGDTNGKES